MSRQHEYGNTPPQVNEVKDGVTINPSDWAFIKDAWAASHDIRPNEPELSPQERRDNDERMRRKLGL